MHQTKPREELIDTPHIWLHLVCLILSSGFGAFQRSVNVFEFTLDGCVSRLNLPVRTQPVGTHSYNYSQDKMCSRTVYCMISPQAGIRTLQFYTPDGRGQHELPET